MSKVEIQEVGNVGSNPISATTAINTNFEAIQDAIDNTLSRDGTAPNQLESNLDLNGKRIINLDAPSAPTDAARWADVTDAATLPELAIPSQVGNAGKVLATNGSNLLFGDGQTIGALLYPNSVFLTGGDPLGVDDSTAALQAALDTGKDVLIPSGTYLANNLTQSTNFQRIIALGNVRIQKNASGDLITSTGADVEFNGISFRGDSSTPAYTGHGIVSTGANLRLINCGARWFSGRAVKATGGHAQILYTCDIYQTTDATGAGYDIEMGVSGTATLYDVIFGIYTSQPTGGILATDTGSLRVIGSQFGKLTIANGTGPGGVNGGIYQGNRILGAVTVGVSGSVFSGNQFGAVAISFATGTSGHSFDRSNTLQAGATLTDDSTLSTVEDNREVAYQPYTCAWSASGSAPDIGDGSISAFYSKKGREVSVNITVTMGSTTTYGTGTYEFSLPAIPKPGPEAVGVALMLDSGTNWRTGIARANSSGFARCWVFYDSGSTIGPTAPFTWASGDQLMISLTYFTE